MIKYQIYDPILGQNRRFDTEDEARQAFVTLFVNVALRYNMGCPYIMVQLNPDGSETYFNDRMIPLSQWVTSTTVMNILAEIQQGR